MNLILLSLNFFRTTASTVVPCIYSGSSSYQGILGTFYEYEISHSQACFDPDFFSTGYKALSKYENEYISSTFEPEKWTDLPVGNSNPYYNIPLGSSVAVLEGHFAPPENGIYNFTFLPIAPYGHPNVALLGIGSIDSCDSSQNISEVEIQQQKLQDVVVTVSGIEYSGNSTAVYLNKNQYPP